MTETATTALMLSAYRPPTLTSIAIQVPVTSPRRNACRWLLACLVVVICRIASVCGRAGLTGRFQHQLGFLEQTIRAVVTLAIKADFLLVKLTMLRGEFDQLTGASVTPRAIIQAIRETLIYFDANRESLFAAPATSTDTEAST